MKMRSCLFSSYLAVKSSVRSGRISVHEDRLTQPSLRLTWSVFALVTGVMLSCLRMVSGGVLAPAVAHAVIDAVNIPLVIRLYREGRP